MSILSDRYASLDMREIWSTESKIRAERNLWISVMKAQAKLGFDIPVSAIAEYEKVKDKVDLNSIDKREKELRHDVKARIEEFNTLAGHEYIHIGMTSRDLTENLEMRQIRDSLELISSRAINVLVQLNSICEKFCDSPFVARTHNVPAQLTTLGRRFASWAEELLYALDNFENTLERLPMRGIKGPVGISTDLKSLFGNNWILIEEVVQNELGFSRSLDAPVQIYPRSIDFEVVANLVQITSAISNVALNVRLMAGHGLVSESQTAKQVGSTVMPHKNNPRLSERLNGLFALLKGLLVSTMETSGNQWNEGDVSCSVVRRFVLPEAFFATDAIFITAHSILGNLVVHEDRIAAEVDGTIDILLSSQILAKSVESGMGREVAHSVIRQLSLEVFNSNGKLKLLELVKKSKQLPIEISDLENLVDNPKELTGEAGNQTRKIITRIEQVVNKFQQRSKYPIPDVDI